MKVRFLKLYLVFCLVLALVLFLCIEFHSPLDLISSVSTAFNQTELNSKLWLQAVSLIFLWFAGLFGLILFSETPTKPKNSTNNP